ncbi:hypothetical protein Aduo_016572 [Ancylostoma duodenale]
MVFRRCIICDERREESQFQVTWKSRPQLALLLALLIHSNDVDAERARFVLQCSMRVKKGKHYCPEHSKKATLFLVGEACTLFENLVDFKKHLREALTNYPAQVAHIVPAKLLQRLQCLTELFDERTILCMRNVVHLINEDVSRYGLNNIVTKACFDRGKFKRKGEIDDEQAIPSPINAARLMVSEERGDTSIDEQRRLLLASKPSPVSTSSTSITGPSSSATQTCSGISSLPERMPHSTSPQSRSSVTQCKRQNEEMCSKVFSIDGERLKKMFRFCPKCGAGIEGDGCINLSRIGVAPFVTVCCSNCTRLAGVA